MSMRSRRCSVSQYWAIGTAVGDVAIELRARDSYCCDAEILRPLRAVGALDGQLSASHKYGIQVATGFVYLLIWLRR